MGAILRIGSLDSGVVGEGGGTGGIHKKRDSFVTTHGRRAVVCIVSMAGAVVL